MVVELKCRTGTSVLCEAYKQTDLVADAATGAEAEQEKGGIRMLQVVSSCVRP